jgi:hypothetical protein
MLSIIIITTLQFNSNTSPFFIHLTTSIPFILFTISPALTILNLIDFVYFLLIHLISISPIFFISTISIFILVFISQSYFTKIIY